MSFAQIDGVESRELGEDALTLEALLIARAYLYQLFHKCFGGALNDALLEVLVDGTTFSIVDEYAEDNKTMKGLLAFLRDFAKQDRTFLLEQAKDEYTRVFVGPSNLPASPYEAPYIGAHDMALFQENTLTVRRIFRNQGLQAKKVQRVPDDHVALMCHFLALLGQRSLEAFDAGDMTALATGLRQQSAFVDGHMTSWLGIYAKAVRNSKAGAHAVLYPQLLEALAAFVESDAVFLKEAAYWAEQVQDFGSTTPPQSAESCARLFAPAVHFVEVRKDLDALCSIRLFGLEENELVAVG